MRFGLPKKSQRPSRYLVEPRRRGCLGTRGSGTTSGRGPRGGLDGFVGRAVLPARASVAKRLRTAPRRACSAVLLGFCRFCGFNGQLLKTGFALPTIGLSSQNCTLRGAAAAIKACKAVLLPTLDVVGRLPRRSGPRASARCDNVKTQIATGSKKLPRQRALEFLPLDALSQPRPAPWYQKPRASGRNLNRGRPAPVKPQS